MSDHDKLRDEIIGIVRSRTGDLLEKNKKAAEFLVDRAARLAALTLDRERVPKDAPDAEARRARIESAMKLVSQSIENDVAALKLEAAAAARDVFGAVLRTAAETLIRGVPILRGLF